MNQFINQFEELVEQTGIAAEQESELIDHILESSVNTDEDEFIQSNLTYDDALEFVQQSDEFTQDCIDHLERCCIPVRINTDSIKSLSYRLAYEDTEQGTALLNELLYYRDNLGRI